MEVGQGPNVGCSAKGKKIWKLYEIGKKYLFFACYMAALLVNITLYNN
jgi:hypothetical protein